MAENDDPGRAGTEDDPTGADRSASELADAGEQVDQKADETSGGGGYPATESESRS